MCDAALPPLAKSPDIGTRMGYERWDVWPAPNGVTGHPGRSDTCLKSAVEQRFAAHVGLGNCGIDWASQFLLEDFPRGVQWKLTAKFDCARAFIYR